MIESAIRTMAIEVRVTRYTCFACPATWTPTHGEPGVSLHRGDQGMELDGLPPSGWNPIQLPNQPRVDLCPRCSALALMVTRRAREAEAAATAAATAAAQTQPAPAETATTQPTATTAETTGPDATTAATADAPPAPAAVAAQVAESVAPDAVIAAPANGSENGRKRRRAEAKPEPTAVEDSTTTE